MYSSSSYEAMAKKCTILLWEYIRWLLYQGGMVISPTVSILIQYSMVGVAELSEYVISFLQY